MSAEMSNACSGGGSRKHGDEWREPQGIMKNRDMGDGQL